jgi:hypothetical protein
MQIHFGEGKLFGKLPGKIEIREYEYLNSKGKRVKVKAHSRSRPKHHVANFSNVSVELLPAPDVADLHEE